jgi:hypothetical protein
LTMMNTPHFWIVVLAFALALAFAAVLAADD